MIDFKKIKTYPIRERKNLESVKNFVKPGSPFVKCVDPALHDLAKAIVDAKKNHKKVILMFGAHLIKRNLSLYIIDLIKQGFVSHLATNGAGSIHDFEIAYLGETSEDVATSIEDGTFGLTEETGAMMNKAIQESSSGYGQAIGKLISDQNFEYKEYSIFYNAFIKSVPITVHVAIGTDIIHCHPSCDGASIGRESYRDFTKFADSVSQLEGGVILNIGSAVILPEVFLKALTISRNLGFKVDKFTAANLDMIKHYRPLVNVVRRPTSKGGKGFNIIGIHESTIPTLYDYIIGGRI